jgi:hypothetical protein
LVDVGQELAELRPSYSGTSHKLNVWVFEIGWTAGIEPLKTFKANKDIQGE